MRRKQSLPFVVLVFCLLRSVPLEAATYTVKAGGGGNYTTIQACANVAVAGDTCVVYAGTYNETVAPAHSGTAGNPITFQVNPGDCVTVTGWSLASLSYITIGTPSIHVCTNGSFQYSGFEITGGNVRWTQINHVTFQSNYAHNSPSGNQCFKGQGTGSYPSSYVSLLNNIISFCGGPGGGLTGGLTMEGDHWLIDGNTVSHVQAAFALYGSYNVVRNNSFGPLSASDFTTQHTQPLESSGVCPGDLPLTHILYENNALLEWRGGNSHGFLLRDTTGCGQTSNIIRFSSHIDSGSYFSVTQTNSLNEYFYNLSISNTQLDITPHKDREDFGFQDGSTNGRAINNLFTNMTQTQTVDWCIYVDATSTGLVENHNLCFMTGYSGSWTGPSSAGGNSYSASDIFNKDPLFVNPASDLHLQAGSPAIGAGGSLTSAIGSGSSSTSLTVADAGFFSDGYGIANVQPDWIRIGASTTVQISSINYSANAITLASAVSWNNNDPIYLYKDSNGRVVLFGSAPDIGAYQFGKPPASPTDLTAVPQ